MADALRTAGNAQSIFTQLPGEAELLGLGQRVEADARSAAAQAIALQQEPRDRDHHHQDHQSHERAEEPAGEVEAGAEVLHHLDRFQP